MNLFTGLTTNQIISFFISGAVFTGFAGLVALSLYAFHVASRPVGGRVRTAAAWHVGALILFMLSIISQVWSAPAEKSFVAADNDALLDFGRFFEDPDARLQKVAIGFVFAGCGILLMLIGARHGGRQKRRMRDAAINTTPAPVDDGGAVSVGRS